MNSFTRIGLPILLVVVAVFLITVATRYTSDPEEQNLPTDSSAETKPGGPKALREPPLKFYTTQAAVTNRDAAPKHMKYWVPEVEIDQPGYFVYWASNKHPQPVVLRAVAANCQCASVEYANMPPDALRDYATASAIANCPLIGSPMPFNGALAQAIFAGKLNWKLLYNKDGKEDGEVPAAGPAGPQMVGVRMNWSGKAEGPRTISTQLLCNVPDVIPFGTTLEASIMGVPSYSLLTRSGDSWAPAGELQMGEIRDNGQSKQQFFVVSANRLYLALSASLEGEPNPCITISPPIPATPEEISSLLSFAPKGEQMMPRVSSMYKFEVTVQEKANPEEGSKKEPRQMDLGVIDRRIRIENSGVTEHRSLMIRGRTLGDISILAGADSGRINMGNGFSVDQDIRKDVTLIAERADLDISLVTKETMPNYLKIKLEPQNDLGGRKNWRLSVVVPKGSLYGSLPANSVIVLKTNEAVPRRIRLPVQGSSYDSGSKP
ncbi:hypothetical protein [Zavarzinella formosa]|uniref:hypothetical protein n=1 Tax=Zavarzinella formosa TaxID=360055 RepID=UPI0002D72988|nr:hypothetical protein [Zavarzinella formosa]